MRIAIAEDSMFVREGLTRILREADLDVVAAYDNADALLHEVRRSPPDLVIVDIRLPPTHADEGIRAAIHIRAHHPQVAVLVLSQYVELGLAMQLLADSAEGIGYLLEDRIGDVNEFIGAVHRVVQGGSAIDPKIVSALVQRRRSENPLTLLTPREREVLALMATGTSNQGIADQLVVSTRAIEKYVSSIFTSSVSLPPATTPAASRPSCSISAHDLTGAISVAIGCRLVRDCSADGAAPRSAHRLLTEPCLIVGPFRSQGVRLGASGTARGRHGSHQSVTRCRLVDRL